MKYNLFKFIKFDTDLNSIVEHFSRRMDGEVTQRVYQRFAPAFI